MTGYARAAGEHGAYRWTWEVKSVNSRALDLRIRLPAGYDRLEMMAREAISARLKRGAVSVSLDVARTEGGTPLQINRELLDQLIELHGELGDSVSGEPPRLESLLAVKGVVEAASETEDAGEIKVRDAAIMGSFGEALDALETARSKEGGRLGDILVGHVDTIEGLCRDAGDAAGARPEALKARLLTQVEELLAATSALPEERLAQEVAILASKADIREELDRITSHVAAARDLLANDGAVGRRLDFVCQELNREANTVCSKSGDAELTAVGIELKAAIDQLREQAQNIE